MRKKYMEEKLVSKKRESRILEPRKEWKFRWTEPTLYNQMAILANRHYEKWLYNRRLKVLNLIAEFVMNEDIYRRS